MNKKPEKIIIVGNQAEAWISAALFAKSLANTEVTILAKPGDDPTTYNLHPENLHLLQHLDITEQVFLTQTSGCFNLGTLFHDWVKVEHDYFQSFGSHGGVMDYVAFQHYVIKQHLSGAKIQYEDYSLTAQAGRQNKFARPKIDSQTILATLIYGITINGSALVSSMRAYVAALGVTIIEADISEILVGEESDIEAIIDATGTQHTADIYLDCSGQERTLISALPGYESKNLEQYFKTDTCIQWQTKKPATIKNHATIVAKTNGWLRQLTDQEQQVNEYYFNNSVESEEQALTICQAHGLDSDSYIIASSDNYVIDAPWLANCVALGSSAASISPLDTSKLHGFIADAFRLLELFPRSANWSTLQYEYNRKTVAWYDHLCHMNIYRFRALNSNSDLSLMNATNLPEIVRRKVALFLDNGQIAFIENEPFSSAYQIAMFLGLDVWPSAYDPLIDNFDIKGLESRFNQMRMDIDKVLAFMPTHNDFLSRDLAS